MKVATLYSRDKRTADNFRGCWFDAMCELDFRTNHFHRKEQSSNIINAVFKFNKNKSDQKVIFGTSEILLFSLFSKSTDIWVFTGLGRLLDGKNKLNFFFVLHLLKILYRKQKIIVLNNDDLILLKSNFKYVHKISGEGYRFNKEIPNRPISNKVRWVYVGRILKSKGVDILLENFLKYKRENHILDLYGDFDFNNSDSISKEFIDNITRRSDNTIRFNGYSVDIKKNLLEADFIVSLSRREGLPFAIFDAIDSGCSCFITDVPGHRDLSILKGVHLFKNNQLPDILQSHDLHQDLKLNKDDVKKRNAEADQLFGYETVKKQIKAIIKNTSPE